MKRRPSLPSWGARPTRTPLPPLAAPPVRPPFSSAPHTSISSLLLTSPTPLPLDKQACKTCGVPKGRAEKLKKLVESKSSGAVTAKVNPSPPRKACFVVTVEGKGGKTFLELLNMKTTNPGRWGPLKEVDFEDLADKIVKELA
jgi:hypothetical protein